MTRKALGTILPILDVGPLMPAERALPMARTLLAGGATWLQLRAKRTDARDLLELARALRAVTREAGALFVVNDRPDVALLADADGVHLGQRDLPVAEVRRWLPPEMFIGLSCHAPEQVRAAAREGLVRYIGYGPVFPTGTKEDADPVVGLEGLQVLAREYPGLPVVAIGGISVERAAAVARAGAASAAMISALVSSPEPKDAMAAALRAFEAGRAEASR